MKLLVNSRAPRRDAWGHTGTPPAIFPGAGVFSTPFVRGCRIVLASLLLVVLTCGRPAAADRKSVLFISSYHPGFPTFFQQVEGIQDAFEGKNILLDIEFMDTKRFPERSNWQRFTDGLTYKLARSTPYDAVMVADDNALVFALEQQSLLFKDTPIVFFGINNVERAIRQDENPQVTGVVEAVSMEETIRLMIHLHPEIRRIIAIVDSTPSGQGDLQTFQLQAGKFDAVRFETLSLARLSWQELEDRLRETGAGSAVLLLSAYTDREGRRLLFHESLERIASNLSAPLYHLWYHGIGDGVLGGKVISHYEQAAVAAKMVLQILVGRPVGQLKVVRESPNRYMFDYPQLKHHGLPTASLPEDSIVVNRPYSYYQAHRTVIWLAVGTIAVLLVALFLSLSNLLRRKQVEGKLRESEEKYRTIIENAVEGFFQSTPDGRFINANPAFARMLGYASPEALMDEITDIATEYYANPEDRHRYQRLLRENGFIQDFEFEAKRRDGTRMWVSNSTRAIFDKGGQEILRYEGNVKDISERKRSEALLIESTQFHRELFENSPTALYLQDFSAVDRRIEELRRSGIEDVQAHLQDHPDEVLKLAQSVNISAVNTAAVALYKAGTRDRLLHNLDQVLWEDDWQHFIDQVVVLTGGADTYEGEARNKTLEGDRIDIILRKAVLHREKNGLSKILVSITDVTRLHRMFQDRQNLEARLREAQKMEAIGSLAGGIAHDFNNILFPIIGLSEMLMDDFPADSPEYENAQQIFQAGERGRDLIEQILAFSRQSEHKPSPVRLPLVIKEVMKLCRPTIPADIVISQKIQEDCGLVMANPTQVHQVILNLITNAYHAVEPTRGEISVRLKEVSLAPEDLPPGVVRAGRYARLSVVDTGSGIDPAHADKIFDPYFTTKERNKGTGLGLAMVYGIVKEYGGEIHFQSELGRGSRFDVYLPLLDIADESPSAQTPRDDPTGSERILLVDDEAAVVRIEEKILERLGYQVTAFTSSSEALAAFKIHPEDFDLLFTDMAMPDLTGERLAGEVHTIRPDLPVVLCTGFSERIDREKASSRGIKGFVKKPATRSAMAAAVRSALDDS